MKTETEKSATEAAAADGPAVARAGESPASPADRLGFEPFDYAERS